MSSKTLTHQTRKSSREGYCAYHCSHTPDVGACAPFGTKNDFGGAVLPSLNVVCEVVANPAGISEIRYLHRDNLLGEIITAFRFLRGFAVKRYACEVFFQRITGAGLALALGIS